MITKLKTMQAIQWNGQSLQLNQISRPEPKANEALIKVSQTGICNTDLEILRGYYPFQGTLGHEFVGIVEESQDRNLIGKRVVCDINFSCQGCSMCRNQEPHHCLNRKTLGIHAHDGAFAEYLCAPTSNLVMVPDSISDEQAVFAEPLAAALEIAEQIDLTQVASVAVLGDGKLGLLITLCLSAKGMNVSLIGHHRKNYHLLDEPKIEFFEAPPNQKFPLVIEATGSPQGFHDALKLTQAKGTLVLKSTYAESFKFNPASLVVDEITLLGSRCGPMDKAIAMMEQGIIAPQKLIDDTFCLNDGLKAINTAQQKGKLKVIMTI